MDERLKRHLEEALKEYSSGLHYQTLIEAKNEYFSRTEQINDEDEDYENRMKSFNDWYILQFISRRGTHTVIKDYLMKNKNQIDDAITKTLLNINHSLFEFLDENMRGEVILKDILHNEKQALAQDHPHPVLLKNDLFVGRVLAFKEQFYLMDGMCLLTQGSETHFEKAFQEDPEVEGHSSGDGIFTQNRSGEDEVDPLWTHRGR